MFRAIGDQPSLWESLLPGDVLRLPEELARVNGLLDTPGRSATPRRRAETRGRRAARLFVAVQAAGIRLRVQPQSAVSAGGR